MSGCSLTGQSSDNLSITKTAILQPQDYLVIVNNTSKEALLPSLVGKNVLHLENHSFVLSADKDEVTLSCDNRVVNRMYYNAYTPRPSNENRRLQLDPTFLTGQVSNDSNNWCYTPFLGERGVDQLSTPGAENPTCLKDFIIYSSLDDQEPVLIDGIDFDATMLIARNELKSEYATAELTLWAIRDQKIPPKVAEEVSALYFEYIDGLYGSKAVAMLDWNHAVWHFAWTISNMYRNGDKEVKARLLLAYEDALTRPETQERFRLIARDHVASDVITMGDMHQRAREYAQSHIVVPGNPDYIQRYGEYLHKKRGDFTIAVINIYVDFGLILIAME